MTQTARKGKLYQLQYQIDLSSLIISHVPVYCCPAPSLQHNSYTRQHIPQSGQSRWNSQICQAGGIGTIIFVLIVAGVCPEMGPLKTLNALVKRLAVFSILISQY